MVLGRIFKSGNWRNEENYINSSLLDIGANTSRNVWWTKLFTHWDIARKLSLKHK